MVSRFTFKLQGALKRYVASDEAREIPVSESVALQSAMAASWEMALKKRVVKKMVRAYSARKRSDRLNERTRKIRSKLASFSQELPVSSTPQGSQDTSMQGRRLTWSRPLDSDDENESDDEPLAVKLRRRVCEVSGDRSDVESDEESREGSPREGSPADESSGEDESEGSSEDEGSESGDDSEDDVIFMGRTSANRSVATTKLRQSLLSQYFGRK
jgi:hypothetical protein